MADTKYEDEFARYVLDHSNFEECNYSDVYVRNIKILWLLSVFLNLILYIYILLT